MDPTTVCPLGRDSQTGGSLQILFTSPVFPQCSLALGVCVCVYVAGSLGPLAILSPSPMLSVLAKLNFVSLSVASAFQLGLELPLQQ